MMTKIAASSKKELYDKNYCVHKYAQDVVDGKIIACEKERQLAKRHLKDLKRQGNSQFPYIFDTTRAERYFRFYEMCYDIERGEYYKILDHQKFDFGLEKGWVKPKSGIRRFTKIYKQQSRGNCKTTECAIDALYELIANRIYPPYEEKDFIRIQNAIIQIMAVDKIQADEMRDPIVNIANNSPALRKFVNAKSTFIKGSKFGGKIQVLSKDLANKQGGKPNAVYVDEYASHPSGKRASTAEQGLGKKEQGFIKYITTAGDYVETNPAKKEYDYARMVLKGEIKDESFLPIIREQDEKDDLGNTALWGKSNPMLRYLPNYKYSNTLFDAIQKEYKRAFENNYLEAQRQFKIYRMDLWQERAVSSYLTANDLKLYDECEVSPADFKKLVAGKSSIDGFDFSIRNDLTADGKVWLLDDDRIAIDGYGYMPLNTLRRHELSDRIPYQSYVDKDYLFTTLGDTTDADEFMHCVAKKAIDFDSKIKEVCYDAYQAYAVVKRLQAGEYDELGAGTFDEKNVIEVPQNNRYLHVPTTLLRDKIRKKEIVHNGNPLLKNHLTNCFVFESKAGELIRVGKEHKLSNKRIDLVAAIINALSRVDQLKEEAWVERMASSDSFF